ncbi:hypothetical protein ACFYQT_39940 [Streptomyces tibetensis]|uniref:Uncharacterized protein n=1 Tax=Streptomyces tibetensis TaxID=2382123 RepID=A0ABW6N9W1_9ACTN
MTAEDKIIHYLKDKVGLTGADTLVAQFRSEIVKRVSDEPLPEFPAGEDPGVVARTVRNMDLRAITEL